MPAILIRRISAYLGPDILLGVFASTQEAERQRDAYFAMRTQTPASDPWHEQPYRRDGLQPSDLVVMNIQGSAIVAGAHVFVISSYSDGFGQTIREFISVHLDKAVAARQAARREEANTDKFPNYFRVQEAIAGQLLPDDPDSQPAWYE
jgi:hypothetical protein